jgi:PAS domain S-box-containing protein
MTCFDAPRAGSAPSLNGAARAPLASGRPPDGDADALRVEVERLRAVLDSALDHAIVTLDLEGRVSGWNCGAEAITGYPAEEAIGRTGDFLLTPEDRAEGVFTFELCRALDGGRATNERWHLRRDGTRFWASGAMLPITDRFGETSGFLNIWRDATETHAAAEQRQLLLSEMNHRVKNTLATVRAVAAQTEHHARTPHDFAESFEARLLALARSNDLLIRGGWKDVPLRELVAGVTAAYPDRFTVSGLPVLLPAALVVPLSLAFHELATNAAKYGALSTSEGRVAVGWRVHPAGRDGRRIEIDWEESGGPDVAPPDRRGFGSELLEHGLHSHARTEMEFRPEGLRCRLHLPLTPVEPPAGVA